MNVPALRIVPVYCGAHRPPPNGRPLGTPAQCFSSGRRGGFVAGVQKGIVEGTKQEKEKQQKKQKIKEVITRTLTKQQFVKEIEDKGLSFLKKEIRLSKLNKDLIRSLATALTKTEQAITRYSSLTREELVNRLMERGFKR
jgi:hypothetical protein